MRGVRSDIYNPHEVAVVHVMAKAVRSMYLFGDDPLTMQCYDYRREWLEDQLYSQAKYFGIDLIAYAIMSNHFHLILCSRPDLVQQWDDTEVANRWLHLCPKRRGKDGKPLEPTEKQLDKIRNNPKELKEIRTRLSDISWWMRLACQKIAQRANREKRETGRFFNGRFKSTRLLDNESILACMAYVDLNPIRAGVCQTIETSSHTSIVKRIQAMNELNKAWAERNDKHLRPVELKESGTIDTPLSTKTSARCSNKGILSMSAFDYIQLVELSARLPKLGKEGATPEGLPPLLTRIGFDLELWHLWTQEFGRLFSEAAGRVETVEQARSLVTNRRYSYPIYKVKNS